MSNKEVQNVPDGFPLPKDFGIEEVPAEEKTPGKKGDTRKVVKAGKVKIWTPAEAKVHVFLNEAKIRSIVMLAVTLACLAIVIGCIALAIITQNPWYVGGALASFWLCYSKAMDYYFPKK